MNDGEILQDGLKRVPEFRTHDGAINARNGDRLTLRHTTRDTLSTTHGSRTTSLLKKYHSIQKKTSTTSMSQGSLPSLILARLQQATLS